MPAPAHRSKPVLGSVLVVDVVLEDDAAAVVATGVALELCEPLVEDDEPAAAEPEDGEVEVGGAEFDEVEVVFVFVPFDPPSGSVYC
jgi:hypothetical protein